MQLSDNSRQILGGRAFAHLALVDGEGRPHVTPVWVDVGEDGRPWINTIVGRVKDRCLPVGAPVALSATAEGNSYLWTSIQGQVAERRTEGAEDDIHALAAKYRGPGSRARTLPGEERVTIVIEPEREFGGPAR